MEKKPIVVIGVMDSELCYLIENLKDANVVKRGDFTFTEGTVDDTPIVIVQCSVGRMVNAAASTMLAIEKYSPRCIITEGTAGAHSPDLHVGDILLGEKFLEVGCYQTPRRKRGEGISIQDRVYSVEDMLPDGVPEKPLYCSEELMQLAESVGYTEGKLRRGTVATSCQWNREIDMIDFYHNTLGSDCEEMESLAVVNVANQFDIPVLSVRIISDSELQNEEFDISYGVTCQKYVLRIIKAIIAQSR